MSIPAPNLDDRRFQDFVDDAKRLLQARIPAWTNHNVHDPGIALIEAVATIADQLVFRLNQVPERHHRKFLELLGIHLRPPTAARTEVTFRLSAPRTEAVIIPANTVVSTRRVGSEAIVSFTTLTELPIRPVEMIELRSGSTDGETQTQIWRDVKREIQGGNPAACFSPVPQPGDRFYVGLSDAAPHGVILLRTDSRVEGIGVDPERPPLRWEAAVPGGWAECDVETDTTAGLNRPGDIVLHLPANHVVNLMNGVRAGWLRAVVLEPDEMTPGYSRSPVVSRVTAQCVGGTTEAMHADYVAVDALGNSDGSPGQDFRTSHSPLLTQGEPVLEVSAGDGWHAWTEVADFSDSDRDSDHYVLDRSTGRVALGPAVRLADGSYQSFGRVPPDGAVIRLRNYWAGGGARGNVAAGSLSVLRTSIPFVHSVTNRKAATGGRDGESVDLAKVRVPALLRSRDRAVTVDDIEFLATEAVGGTARVRCIPPQAAGEPIRVLVVPDVTSGEFGRVPFAALTPSVELLTRIATALDQRRLAGARIVVEPPHYRGITVAARIRPRRDAIPDMVRDDALAALYTWFHPWIGGPDGRGWPFGRPISVGDIHAVLAQAPGVDYVEDARLYPADPTTAVRGEMTQRLELDDDALPFSYEHQVQVSRLPRPVVEPR